jgi:hypothetical protein
VVKLTVVQNRPYRKATIWPAILAIALQVLWPVIATGNAAVDALSEIDTPHEHTVIDGGGDDAPGHDDKGQSHCGFCSTAAVTAVLAPYDLFRAWNSLDTGAAKAAAPDLPQPVSAFEPSAYPRAPPLFS